MTIEKGGIWGEPWPEDLALDQVPEAADDAELARRLADAMANEITGPGAGPFAITPRSGDLLRTIGLEEPRGPGDRYRYPIDLGMAHLGNGANGGENDGGTVLPFVAHLTVRNRPLTGIGPGLSVAVMNAAWLGHLRLGPRAHPNDGLVDVTDGTVGILQRREANRRAASGSHLPHPALSTTRGADWERTWPRPVRIWLDGRPVGRFRSVVVEVVADAGLVLA